jgi:hypothetical protein
VKAYARRLASLPVKKESVDVLIEREIITHGYRTKNGTGEVNIFFPEALT